MRHSTFMDRESAIWAVEHLDPRWQSIGAQIVLHAFESRRMTRMQAYMLLYMAVRAHPWLERTFPFYLGPYGPRCDTLDYILDMLEGRGMINIYWYQDRFTGDECGC